MAKITKPVNHKPEDLVFMVSKVNKILQIPKIKRSFPNKENLEFKLKANVPVQVPFYVAQSYSESYPHIYAIVSDEEAEVLLLKKTTQTVAPKVTDNSNFSAVDYLNNTNPVTKDKLVDLGDKELFLIAEFLELQPSPETEKVELIESILVDLETKRG